MLLGREEECAQLEGLLTAAREGAGGVLVLRGQAGIGKTALLEHAVREARGARVVRVAGIESETEIGFAALHQLLLPFLGRLPSLPPPQRSALAAVFGLRQGKEPERFLVGLAALSLLADAAGEPLLCVVDDAQWLDQESAQVLAFVARRLQAERLVMMFAVREPTTRLLPLTGLPDREIRGLAPRAAAELLASATPGRPDDRISERIVAETGGNPLALIELAHELDPGHLTGAARLPDPLPISQRLGARFVREVRDLPASSQMMLLTAAAEQTGDPAVLWRAGAELGFGWDAGAVAEARQLLEPGTRVRFRHPLIRSAVYYGASSGERQRVHQVLAAVTDPDRDPDRRAWHLAEAAPGPDEVLAAALEDAAGTARSRGGSDAEVIIRMRAAELTPEPARRAGRLVATAQAALNAGAFSQAGSLVESAEPALVDPLTRALAAEIRGKIQMWAGGSTARLPALLLTTARAYEHVDVRRRREKLLEAMDMVFTIGQAALEVTPLEIAKEALALAPPPEGEATPGDLLLEGCATLIAIGYAEAVPVLHAALAGLADQRAPGTLGVAAAHAVWDDRFADERAPAVAGPSEALGRGRYRDAFEAARHLCELEVVNLDHQRLPDLIEAGVRCGERDQAQSALSRLRTKAQAAGTPWALGLLARSEALLAKPADAERLYLLAIEHLARTRITADLARAYLLYGEWLRRHRRRNDARARLSMAHDMFVEMGAAAFADRCRIELVAAGTRPGASDDLTPQERQIATLAAGRATNQEIAAQLFISPSTVDYHLKKVFRKLGVTSRRQLTLRKP
ncbi:helix-turn-helix transcriptional regulator [Sphaerisporangium aureirubrum]|uniref:AAA family ATPase n=1 Tax=Sphaerisporangium aureirubrum TaxID=1544736 RepID=A0ABW1NKP1_9ACTN